VATKVGEVQATMTSSIKKDQDVRALLRVNWTDKSKEISFKPAVDLEMNDKIRITVEKI
jgi:hypothetical protein